MHSGPLSAEEFEQWLNEASVGDPEEARAFCERTMSPNYIRYHAGDQTDFERAVEKVKKFRSMCRMWNASVLFLVQDGQKIAIRLICDLAMGTEKKKKIELMLMAEKDEEGRFEKVWVLTLPSEGGST